jgi:RNA-splicing ligase RtcB
LIEELEERVVAAAGLCRKVAQLRPLGVIKG